MIAEGWGTYGVSGVQWWAGCGVSMVARGWDGFLADFAECAEWLEQHLHSDVVFLILEVCAEK